ncbi:MAG TPA: hypothetical protein PLF81_08215 [Candidatus Anammoximicrobium sp.]|nr:hypothetical protein [Candidatus Anammoximicrobium sp.]
MMDGFLLWHVHEFPSGKEDAKLIGVYSSPELAGQAQQRVGTQPGFRDAPPGFSIHRYAADRDHWSEGYLTETHEDILPLRQADNAGTGAALDRSAS